MSRRNRNRKQSSPPQEMSPQAARRWMNEMPTAANVTVIPNFRVCRDNPPTSLRGEADLDVSAVAAGHTRDQALVLELRDEAHRPRVRDAKRIGDAAQVGTA